MPVLAAVDVDQAPHRPISVGYDLAVAHAEPLVVVSVMSNEEFDRRQQSREDALPEEFDQRNYTLEMASDAATERAKDEIEATLDTYDREQIEVLGMVGDPADRILAAVEEVDPSYVVVGGRKRSLARQALFGSVSQKVMRNVEQSVVTVMEEPEA